MHTDSLTERSAHHRDLHSFPTRRSSDLAASEAGDVTQTRAGQPRHPLFGRAQKRSGPAQMTRHVVAHPYVYHRDRKSTRLNSSHLGISYAVFCLKKKITR